MPAKPKLVATKKGKKLKATKASKEEQEPVSNFRRDDNEPIGARTGEQPNLIDVESDEVPIVERAAKALANFKDARKQATANFNGSKVKLIAAMVKHNLEEYHRNGVHVDLTRDLDVEVEIE